MAMAALHDQILLVGSNQENELLVIDAATGGQLYAFKHCKPSRNGVIVVPRTHHLLGIQDHKLALHVWTWGKDMPIYKCHIAEKMGPVVTTACGNYVFAGAYSGKIYVWDVKTGELVMAWDAHYKRVTAMALTSDSSHLITAGEDAVVHVWRLMEILDEPDISASFQTGLVPFVSWTDHVLPVTSLHVGLGGVNARIYTSSLDRTVKIWSLHSTQCLYSLTCPSFVNVCCTDTMEHRLFMGCGNGNIYVLDLHAAASAVTATTARLVSSSSTSTPSITKPWEKIDSLQLPVLQGHEVSVTALQTSPCGGFLVSGDENGSIRVWDSLSRQSLRTIQLIKGAIATLILMPRPTQLFPTLKATTRQATDGRGMLPIAPFKKYMGTGQAP